MNLIRFEFGVVISIWFCYVFDMVWVMVYIWYWMWLIRFQYGSNELASKKETETTQGQVSGRFFEGFCGFMFWYDFDMILIRFWHDFDTILMRFLYDFDTILTRFWYGFDTVLIWLQCVGFKKRNRNSPGTGFWSIFRGFFFAVLIWFWHGFDAILIRFWYVFDTILIWFWVLIWFWIWFRWVGFKSQFWPTSRIITETISESYLNPYQHHNCKTTPGTIHNNKSYLKRIKIIKKNILKNLHPRDFGCYKSLEFSPRPCNLRDCLSIVTHTLSLYGTLTQKRLKLIVSEWTEHWVHATGWAWIYSQISRTEKVRTGMVKNKYQKNALLAFFCKNSQLHVYRDIYIYYMYIPHIYNFNQYKR